MLADLGYEGERAALTTPIKQITDAPLAADQRTVNLLHAASRGPAERGNSLVDRDARHLHDRNSSLEQGDVGDVVLRHGPWTSRHAYVAGPAAMVYNTVWRLLVRGLPRERIRTEVFALSRPGPSVAGSFSE